MTRSPSPLGARRGIGKTSLFGVLIAVFCLAALAFSATGASAAKWTTRTVPLPASATEAKLKAVDCPLSSTCIGVGSYGNGGGSEQLPLAEHWNGSTWSVKSLPLPNAPFPMGSSGSLNGVSCTGTSSCTAVGTYKDNLAHERPFAYRWNGSTWSLMAMAELPGEWGGTNVTESGLEGVSCVSTTCVAVGTYHVGAGGVKQAWSASYNGTTWTAESLGRFESLETRLTGVSCTSTTACVAVGHANTGVKGLAVIRSAGKWGAMSSIAAGNRLQGISCASATNCEAVGYGTATKTPVALGYNGTTWAAQSPAAPAGSTSSELIGVDCFSTTCSSSGSYVPSGGSGTPLAEQFAASTWSLDLPNSIAGATNQSLSGIACYPAPKCMSVGSYTSGGKVLPMAQTSE
jgi:hypothetical protein